MEFTYKGYGRLITILKEHNYRIASYHDWQIGGGSAQYFGMMLTMI